jgi:hypothetical protein
LTIRIEFSKVGRIASLQSQENLKHHGCLAGFPVALRGIFRNPYQAVAHPQKLGLADSIRAMLGLVEAGLTVTLDQVLLLHRI